MVIRNLCAFPLKEVRFRLEYNSILSWKVEVTKVSFTFRRKSEPFVLRKERKEKKRKRIMRTMWYLNRAMRASPVGGTIALQAAFVGANTVCFCYTKECIVSTGSNKKGRRVKKIRKCKEKKRKEEKVTVVAK